MRRWKRAAHQVFWDQRIPAGGKWETWIGKLVRQAGCVVVWSRSSVKSQHIQAADLINYQPGQPSEQFVSPKGPIDARAFWDGSTAPRELHVNVAIERPYRKPPKAHVFLEGTQPDFWIKSGWAAVYPPLYDFER